TSPRTSITAGRVAPTATPLVSGVETSCIRATLLVVPYVTRPVPERDVSAPPILAVPSGFGNPTPEQPTQSTIPGIFRSRIGPPVSRDTVLPDRDRRNREGDGGSLPGVAQPVQDLLNAARSGAGICSPDAEARHQPLHPQAEGGGDREDEDGPADHGSLPARHRTAFVAVLKSTPEGTGAAPVRFGTICRTGGSPPSPAPGTARSTACEGRRDDSRRSAFYRRVHHPADRADYLAPDEAARHPPPAAGVAGR